jgi:phosphotriesterase-related protein
MLRQHDKVLTLLEAEGADLSRVVLGHSDFLAGDLPYLTRLLDRGVTVEFDLLGRPPVVTRTRATDVEVAATIVALVKAGHADRLVLSHDICTKTSLKAYGGTGYSFIEELFLPYLKRHGVTDAQITAMVVENPKRLLTFAAPKPPGGTGR